MISVLFPILIVSAPFIVSNIPASVLISPLPNARISLSSRFPFESKSIEPLIYISPARFNFTSLLPFITSVSFPEPTSPPPLIITFVPVNVELSPIVIAVLYALTTPLLRENSFPLVIVTVPLVSPAPLIIILDKFVSLLYTLYASLSFISVLIIEYLEVSLSSLKIFKL